MSKLWSKFLWLTSIKYFSGESFSKLWSTFLVVKVLPFCRNFCCLHSLQNDFILYGNIMDVLSSQFLFPVINLRLHDIRGFSPSNLKLFQHWHIIRSGYFAIHACFICDAPRQKVLFDNFFSKNKCS